jgi:hypothetical protein
LPLAIVRQAARLMVRDQLGGIVSHAENVARGRAERPMRQAGGTHSPAHDNGALSGQKRGEHGGTGGLLRRQSGAATLGILTSSGSCRTNSCQFGQLQRTLIFVSNPYRRYGFC